MKIETSIQKWGNGLALRVSGIMRDIPHFKEGMQVIVDVTEEGFTVKKMIDPAQKKKRFSEKELLKGMTAYTAHADEVSNLSDDEWGA
jgi:antitoxin MazE